MKHSQIICTQINQADPSLADKKNLFISSIDGISVRVNVDDWDRLAVSLVDMEVTAAKPNTLEDGEAFIDRCSRLADRLCYLEESLNVVEVDGRGRIGIIRSYPPMVEEGRISYFEIEADGKTRRISLRRVVRDTESAQDRPGKTVLGYHILGRLINDLSEAAQIFY